MMNEIVVYTDGACSGNGRRRANGGIGIHFPNHELPDVSQKYTHENCTNQRTELYAILTALRLIRKHLGLRNRKVIIYSDSQYSINSITVWAKNHKKNNWCKRDGKPICNRDYIELLYEYYCKYDIEIHYVEAHVDNEGNNIADALAQAGKNENKQNKEIVLSQSFRQY